MKAFQRDSRYISENFEQEAGDLDWVTQTPQMETTLEKLSVYTGTTATQIVTYDKDSVSVEIGDKLLVNDGGTWKEITVEGITESPGDTTVAYNSTFSQSSSTTGSSPLYQALGNVSPAPGIYRGGASFSPDGLRAWLTTTGGSYGLLRQLDLSTPYNLKTVTGVNSYAYINSSAWSSYGGGFMFANNGKYFYAPSTSNGQYLTRYLLSTPYDITTITNQYTQYNNAFSTTYSFNGGAFSPDGTKFVIRQISNTYYGICTTPFDITTASISGFSTGPGSKVTSFTHDGKYMVSLFDDNTTIGNCYLEVWDMSADPCNLPNAAYSVNYLTTIGSPSYMNNSNNNSDSNLFISQNLKHISIIPAYYATQSIHALTTTLGRKYTIDISTQGLSNAPTDGNVYLATKPTLKIASSPRTEAFTYNYRLYHNNASTTSAKIHYNKSGVLAAGDTILVNGTTPVTLSTVTETTSNVDITSSGSSGNGIRYIGSYATGKSMYWNGSDGGWGPKFQISTDGKKLFVFQGATASTAYNYGSGIYVYDLTTPWEISTATPSGVDTGRHLCQWSTLLSFGNNLGYTLNNAYWGGYWNLVGFEFSPDGTKVTIGMTNYAGNAGIWVYTLNLARPWDLWSILSTTNPAVTYTAGTSSYVLWRDMFFNIDGTQLILVDDYNGGSTSYVYYYPFSTTTPWVGATAIPSTATNTTTQVSDGGNYRLITRFTPDGKRLINIGNGGPFGTGVGQDVATPQWANLTNQNNLSSSNYPATWTSFSSTYWTTAIKNNFTGVVTDHRFSPDGLRWYIMMDTGVIHQLDGNFNVDAGVMYNITYPTQSSTPTSYYIPDQSTTQTLTAGTPTSVNSSYGTVTYTGSQENISGARSVKFQLDGPTSVDLQVNTVRIDLEKEV